MSKVMSIALAAALGLAPPAGPLAAEPVTLRVPVQLKKMVAEKAKVSCSLGHDGKYVGGNKTFDIVNGEFDQVIEIVITPVVGMTFVGTDQYSCTLLVGAGAVPQQATPSGNNDPKLYYLAKPDQFFRAQTTGRLDGVGVVNPDLGGGPKDFKGKKQP